MKHRKIIVALLMFGIITFGVVSSMNNTPNDIPRAVDTAIIFPLDDKN